MWITFYLIGGGHAYLPACVIQMNTSTLRLSLSEDFTHDVQPWCTQPTHTGTVAPITVPPCVASIAVAIATIALSVATAVSVLNGKK